MLLHSAHHGADMHDRTDLDWILAHRRILLALAMLCYVPPLFFHYVGEEANYTLMSMEMWQHQSFRSVVVLGGVGGRPPLYNWLMIPLAWILGWKHVLVAARLVTVSATFGTALTLGWLARKVVPNPQAALLAPLFYLVTADVLCYRGWLAYADPLFSFWMVLAVSLLWVSSQHRDARLLFLSLLAILASYLTKVITAYFFYAAAWCVLVLHAPYRQWLWSLRAWGVYLAGLIPLLLWWYFAGRHDSIQTSWQEQDIASKLLGVISWKNYGVKLATFPVSIVLGLLPSSWIVARALARRKASFPNWPLEARLALGIAALNFLPYWVAPQSAARYVLPVYGFVVLAAVVLWTSGLAGDAKPRRWVTVFLLLGGVVNGLAFPVYQREVRGENYGEMAHFIERYYYGRTPIYVTDWSSVGLSVTALIDSRHFDRPALTTPPSDFKDGLVIARTPQDVQGMTLPPLRVGAEQTDLICRGRACLLGPPADPSLDPATRAAPGDVGH